MNDSGEPWGIGTIAGCLVPGPELTEGKGNIGLVCESGKEVVGNRASGLVGGFVIWFLGVYRSWITGKMQMILAISLAL